MLASGCSCHQGLRHLWPGTQKRDVVREVSIEHSLNQSSRRLDALLPARDASPSGQAAAGEQQLQLAKVLERLPDDYRRVILLRNIEEFSHEQIC